MAKGMEKYVPQHKQSAMSEAGQKSPDWLVGFSGRPFKGSTSRLYEIVREVKERLNKESKQLPEANPNFTKH